MADNRRAGMRLRSLNRSRYGPSRVGALVCLLAIAAASCTNHHHGAAGSSMSLQMSSGSAVIAGGGSTRTVTDRAGLDTGYRVTVAPGGLAVLSLGSGRVFELTEGEALITGEDRVQLVRGNALGELSAPGEIDIEGMKVVSTSGTFRVQSGLSSRVDVYLGGVRMIVPGASLTVPAYREAVAVAGLLPRSAQPLQITAGGDVWDQRFLRDAIDLDTRLANFGGGLDAQLGSATGLQFFRLAVPDSAEVDYVAPFFTQPRSDVLIGLVIAQGATAGNRADPQSVFDQIMGLWLAGESWGTLAMEYRVSAQDVFAGLLDAIRRVGISLSTPKPNIVPIPVATPALGLGTAPKTTAMPQPAETPTHAPTPAPTAKPLLNQVLDPLTTLLTQILNLLLPQTTTSTAVTAPPK